MGHGVRLNMGGGGARVGIDHGRERGGGRWERFRRKQHRWKKVYGGGGSFRPPSPSLSATPVGEDEAQIQLSHNTVPCHLWLQIL